MAAVPSRIFGADSLLYIAVWQFGLPFILDLPPRQYQLNKSFTKALLILISMVSGGTALLDRLMA